MKKVQTGDRLGEYILRDKLGEGGFGVVWKAENPDLPGKIVAIKVPKTDEALRMLQAEARAQHKLEHPGIVRTLTVNLKHEPPYAVMDFVSGESLRQVLLTKGTLNVEQLVEIGRSVLEAVAFAHAEDVVHGDISPSNVILDNQGRCRLTDFGLSKDCGIAQDSLSLSRTGSADDPVRLLGTFAYMAPEQRLGNRKTKESDVFALGVLLLELATGDPSYMRFPIPNLPTWLSNIIETSTMRETFQRFPDAQRMLAELDSARSKERTLQSGRPARSKSKVKSPGPKAKRRTAPELPGPDGILKLEAVERTIAIGTESPNAPSFSSNDGEVKLSLESAVKKRDGTGACLLILFCPLICSSIGYLLHKEFLFRYDSPVETITFLCATTSSTLFLIGASLDGFRGRDKSKLVPGRALGDGLACTTWGCAALLSMFVGSFIGVLVGQLCPSLGQNPAAALATGLIGLLFAFILVGHWEEEQASA